MTDRQKQFGVLLKQIRQTKGLSQEKLAFITGSKRTYLSEIETGKHNISISFTWKLAEALHTHPATFFLKAKEATKLPKILIDQGYTK